MERAPFLQVLVERIIAVERSHPVRVGIDGVDGVGKTMLADELVDPIRRRGRSVIRASIDGFHNPRSVRYRKGRGSPAGFFPDSFNLEAVVAEMLGPLGPGGSLCHRRAVFDHRTDSEVNLPVEMAEANAVLLFDGVFLHRPELRGYWDFSVFLDAPFAVTVPRCAGRDGSSADVNAGEQRRYVEGQELYLRECEPWRVATMVIDYEDVRSPEIVGPIGNLRPIVNRPPRSTNADQAD